MGLTGKRTAWNSVNGLLRRWEGLEGQTEDFRQTPGAWSAYLDQARNHSFKREQNPPTFRLLSPPPQKENVTVRVCGVCECRGHLSGGSPLLPLLDSD